MNDLASAPSKRAAWFFPCLWFVAALAFLVATQAPPHFVAPDHNLHMTYYVVAHTHYAVTLATLFATFGVIYILLSFVLRRPIRLWLGYLHLGLMLAGVALIFAPGLIVSQQLARRADDVDFAAFTALTRISSAGYLVLLVGIIAFAVVLIDALRRKMPAP